MGFRKFGVECDALCKERYRFWIAETIDGRSGFEKESVGFRVLCRAPAFRRCTDVDLQGSEDLGRHVVLHGKDVGQRAVVGFRPEVRAICDVDQLSGNAHPLARFAHRAFESRAHIEGFADDMGTKMKDGMRMRETRWNILGPSRLDKNLTDIADLLD